MVRIAVRTLTLNVYKVRHLFSDDFSWNMITFNKNLGLKFAESQVKLN